MTQKVALVTGAGKGIGRGIATSLAAAGYDLGIHYATSSTGAEEIAQRVSSLGRKAVILKADIKDIAEIDKMYTCFFTEFDHLDLLVNNAGITKAAPFLEVTQALWEEVMNTDLRGTFFSSQFAARQMVKTGTQGVIIHIGSNHSQGCWPNSTVYAAAKAGLDKLTKNMALDLAPHGIRVVTIAPGYTQLEWFTEKQDPYMERTASRIPLRRFATPDEIGAAVVFLASQGGNYITGTTLFMDGGALLPVVAANDYI